MAVAVIDRLRGTEDYGEFLRCMFEIAANWQSFHLAQDEYAARATCQKAREVLGKLQILDAAEREAMEREQRERRLRQARQHQEDLQRQSSLLLMMFDELVVSDDAQKRGYLLQELLTQLFRLHEIPAVEPFTRNQNAEQIDGAFKLDGWHYLVECRWRKQASEPAEVDAFLAKIGRSGKPAMGLFLSINRWSQNVPLTLKQNPNKSVVLMDGYDLRMVLAERPDLEAFLAAKAAKLSLEAEPFLSVQDFLREQTRRQELLGAGT